MKIEFNKSINAVNFEDVQVGQVFYCPDSASDTFYLKVRMTLDNQNIFNLKKNVLEGQYVSSSTRVVVVDAKIVIDN